MATVYVRSSDGDNGDNGSTWALAKKTLEDGGMSSTGDGAITAAGAGGTIFASSASHAQTEASNVALGGGTIDAPIRIYSVDDTQAEGSEVLATGASIATTGATPDIDMNGYLYFHGFTITTLSTMRFSSPAAETKLVFEKCSLFITGTNGGRVEMGISGRDVFIVWVNTTLNFNNNSQQIRPTGNVRFLWLGGAFVGTSPSNFLTSLITGGNVVLRNVDLSPISGNLIVPGISQSFFDFKFERCKLNAGVTIISTAIPGAGMYNIRLQSCDSGDTTYSFIEEYYEGTNIDETTIVRTGGASDGTTSQSIKMVSNTHSIEIIQPLVSPPIVAWTDATGSTTFTIEFIHDSVTDLQDDEIWMELEYPGADAQGVIARDVMGASNDDEVDPLGTPANQTTSSETWTTTGMSNPNTQKLSVTVTPGKIGPVTVRVYLGKASTTVYVDQVITES